MSRVDELTLRLLDDEGTPAERAELGRLLDRDPRALRKHLALMEVELALRAGGRRPDVAPEVMERIRAQVRARRPLRPLPRPQARPHPPGRKHGVGHLGTRWRTWLLWLVLLGSAATGALIAARSLHPSQRGLPAATVRVAKAL